MMETADHGRLNDPALVEALHRSRVRGVLGEGEVGPGTVVVGEVRAQQAVEVGFVQRHEVSSAGELLPRATRLLVLSERHLRRILTRYFAYYHQARTHLALDKDAPDLRPIQRPATGKIVQRPEVGGLHHRYIRHAA